MKQQDRRFIVGAELRAKRAAGDDALIVEARIAKYGALSNENVPVAGARERFAAGAFRDSLANSDDVLGTFNHDANAPLGRVSNGKLKLQDSPEALYATFRLNPAVQAHKDLYELCKDGCINACSFAFSPNQNGESWSNEKDERGQPYMLRTVRSAKLFDVSLLSAAPAYGNGATSVQARSLAYNFSTVQTRRNVKSYEQIFFEQTGTEFHLPKMQAARQAAQIVADFARAKQPRDKKGRFGSDKYVNTFKKGDRLSDGKRDCPAGSCVSTREEHEQAVTFHRNKARHAEDLRSFEEETAKADNHQSVLDWDNDVEDGYGDRVSRCVASCRTVS